jgi:hypothetical protein
MSWWCERICVSGETTRLDDTGDEAEDFFALSQDGSGVLSGHQVRELRDLDLREHFGA